MKLSLCLIAGPCAVVLAKQANTSVQTANLDSAKLPAFEVASVKPDPAADRLPSQFGSPFGKYINASNVTVKTIIKTAYDLQDFQISGGPAWINTDKYDINAKVDDAVYEQLQKLSQKLHAQQTKLMLQLLLADRFKLQIIRNTVQLPVLVLEAGSEGPKLTDSGLKSATPPNGNLEGSIWILGGQGGQVSIEGFAASVDNFAESLSRMLGRKVINQTGLQGNYSFKIAFVNDVQTASDPDSANSSGPSIFAVVQEQLGLRLKGSRGPVDTIAIAHIERPDPN
jgi:bla regulator protein blaR1